MADKAGVQPTEKSEDELWVEYRKTHDPKIRDFFIRQYAPLVKYVAGKVAAGMPHNVEFDDLVSQGVFGLMDAIEKFDPAKNVKFNTYAVVRIRGAIFDEMRSTDWVPRSVRTRIREMETAISTLEGQLGRSPADEEIAAYMKMDMDEYFKTLMKISSTSVISLNETWPTGDDNEQTSIGESITGPESLNPDVEVERDEIRHIVIQYIQELPDKEKKIIVLYHYEGLTLKEIGQVLDITESRVSQLHTKAMLMLKAKLTNVRKGIT
jgi:RNA polymerase sigma factor for flagellar operon FliA